MRYYAILKRNPGTRYIFEAAETEGLTGYMKTSDDIPPIAAMTKDLAQPNPPWTWEKLNRHYDLVPLVDVLTRDYDDYDLLQELAEQAAGEAQAD